MATRKLVVEVIGDTSSVERALGKTGKETDNLNSRFGSLTKTAGKAGVAGAIIGLGYAVKAGVSEFSDAQKVTAQTNAVLKSTGGVANVSRQEIEKLSGALLRKSGVDDEAIQSGANMLLTFTKIRNEVGAGNNIFDQATRATLDLSVAMGKDMQSSAILVGKALNDPIKGMSALSRAGIQFTEEQKETIKTLVATGDTLGAQKIILAELETQFGGSAEAAGSTFAGQLNIARETALNFAGGLVEKSIPALNSLATFISEDAIPVLRRFHGWFKDNVNPVIARLKEIAENTWNGIATVLKENEPEIKRILGAVESAARAIGTVLLWLLNNVWIPYLSVMFEKAIPAALKFTIDALNLIVLAITGVTDGMTWLKNNAGAAINTFWNDIKGPLALMKSGVEKVAAGFKAIREGIEWLIDNAKRFEGILSTVGAVLDRLPGVGSGDVAAGFNSALAQAQRARYADVAGPGAGSGGLAPQTASLLQTIMAQFGNVRLTSGFRTPEQNAAVNGAPNSDHLTGRAIDLVPATGWNPATIALFDQIAAFAASLRNVRWVGWRGVPGHGPYDHLHISTFDRGGWLMPGLTLAQNNTGRPERVLAGAGVPNVTVYVAGSVQAEQDLATTIRNAIVDIGVRNDGTGL